MMEKKNSFLIIGTVLIIISIILSILSVISALSLRSQRLAFLEDEDIYYELFSVKMEDGVEIKGLLYVDEELQEKEDKSVPSVLLLHGINGRKEAHFNKIFQFVKYGYAVFSVELRGHGESGGISTFFEKEPYDMMEVIDYIGKTYDFSNSSHMALLAFSFGGGVATVLQALDDDVYASVIYHPLSSIDRFLERVPIQNLLGSTPAIRDLDEIEDGFDLCTPENTENLLLIHGEEDDIILAEDSEDLYEQVDGDERDDIGLEIRPDIGHGANEGDETSFKHTLVWFEHFYHNRTINITNRNHEIKYIQLYENNYPGGSNSGDLLMLSAIIMFFGICLLTLPTVIWSLSKENASNINKNEDIERHLQEYKKMIKLRVFFYFIPVVICGVFLAIFNQSLMYGYFLIIPIVTLTLMLFIPSSDYLDWKSEWHNWYENKLKIFLVGIAIPIVPVLLYVVIFNLNAHLMITSPIGFFTPTLLIYLSMVLSSVMMDCLLLRGWKLKHTIILIGLRPLTLLLFLIFVPIPSIPFVGGYLIHIILISLIGIIFWMMFIQLKLFEMIFKNKIVIILIVALPIIVFLLHRFFRIV